MAKLDSLIYLGLFYLAYYLSQLIHPTVWLNSQSSASLNEDYNGKF